MTDHAKKVSMVERARLFADLAKHMMTLATAANVFVITAFEKLSKAPNFKICIPLSITFFCFCILLSLISVAGLAAHTNIDEPPSDETTHNFSLSAGFFMMGFLSLVFFVWMNIF